MQVDGEFLKRAIESELATLSDTRVVEHVRARLVKPCVVPIGWDYGEPGQQYPCWIVLYDPRSNCEIAYSEHGFGPRCPWGLVNSKADDPRMGKDSGWFTRFLDAFFESFACIELPIWRVYRTALDRTRVALSDEGEWEATWNRVSALRVSDPDSRYDCDHSIAYGR
jgi:hypothetical protein